MWRRLKRGAALWIGIMLVSVSVIAALLAPWISPHDPNVQDIANKLASPSHRYLLGTDGFGRDILSRILWGARVSLFVGFVSTAVAVMAGAALGIISGYCGGRIDKAISSGNDILMSFPQIILGIVIVALLGPSITNLIIAIAVTAVPAFFRLARGSTLAMKELDFVDACRSLGMTDLRIMFRHILPNIGDDVTVLGSLWLATAIRTEASLSFIGLGAPPPTATLGGLVRDGFENILDSAGLAIYPSIAILIVMIGLNLIGDGLRDVLDPRVAT